MMEKYKAIIVDDEELALADIRNILEDLPHIEIIAEATNLKDANDHILFYKPDILFLDIQMREGTIFPILEDLEQRELKMGIIFLTGYYNDFLKEAFDTTGVNYPVAYLQKPADTIELLKVINKIKKKLDKPIPSDNYLKLDKGVGVGFIRIFYGDILYCETDGKNFVKVITTDQEEFRVRLSLKKLYNKLPPKHFYKLSGKNIINRNYVRHGSSIIQGEYSCYLKVGTISKAIEIPLGQWSSFKASFGV